MSCGCNTTGGPYYNGVCREDLPYPQVSHESVPSLIDNLVAALYGSFYNPQTQTGYITKSVVNGRIVWNIPCDPNNTSTINDIPRNNGEGLLCYILRSLNLTIADNGFVTVNGVQTLSNKTFDSTCTGSLFPKAIANISSTASVTGNQGATLTATQNAGLFTIICSAITTDSVIIVTPQGPTNGGYAPVATPAAGGCTVQTFSGYNAVSEPFSIVIF